MYVPAQEMFTVVFSIENILSFAYHGMQSMQGLDSKLKREGLL